MRRTACTRCRKRCRWVRLGRAVARSVQSARGVTVHDIVAIPGLALRLLAGEDAPTAGPVGARERARGPDAVAPRGEPSHHRHGRRRHPAAQRAYLRRLVTLAPAASLRARVRSTGAACARDGGREHAVPLFQVPYPVPFIASPGGVQAPRRQYDVLQRAVRRSTSHGAVLEEGVDGIASSLAVTTAGSCCSICTDTRWRRRAARRSSGGPSGASSGRGPGSSFSLTLSTVGTTSGAARARTDRAFLAVSKTEQRASSTASSGHALSLFASGWRRQKAVADAERRLRGTCSTSWSPGGSRRTRRAGSAGSGSVTGTSSRSRSGGRWGCRGRQARARRHGRELPARRRVPRRGPGRGHRAAHPHRSRARPGRAGERDRATGGGRAPGGLGLAGRGRRRRAIAPRGSVRAPGLPARRVAPRRVRGSRDVPALQACGQTRCARSRLLLAPLAALRPRPARGSSRLAGLPRAQRGGESAAPSCTSIGTRSATACAGRG
jgi:hypothetical protein